MGEKKEETTGRAIRAGIPLPGRTDMQEIFVYRIEQDSKSIAVSGRERRAHA